jgi:hypothetical protein
MVKGWLNQESRSRPRKKPKRRNEPAATPPGQG